MNQAPVDFRTTDLDEFREIVGGLLRPFSLAARAKKYDARLCHRQLGTLGFTHISYNYGIDIDVPFSGPAFLMQVPLRGSFQVLTTGSPQIISGKSAHIAPPQRPMKMRCPGAIEFLVTSLDPSEFAQACALNGADSRILSKLPNTLLLSGPGASLAHCLKFLHAEALREDTLLGGKRVVRPAQQMLYALLLDLAPHESSRSAAPGRSWYIKRAEEFMVANLGADIGIGDVAAGASISMRALQYGFRNVHGVSPMVWLKQRRLDRVHATLLAADPAETTVTDVALRWGFVHLGRFAADYLSRFGERPSVTLRRR